MLRNVVDSYLAEATERSLDLPLLRLLPALGFTDVHLVHGSTEFGKDFIGKLIEDGDQLVQYVLQSKSGNIAQAEFRQIQQQLIEAATIDLGHPNLDNTLPRQIVLVTTGSLCGNARNALKNLNEGFLSRQGIRPILCWDGSNLSEMFLNHGLSSVHPETITGFADYGQFFLAYSGALQGTITDRDIEEYSRQWLAPPALFDRRLLRASIETEIFAQLYDQHGRYWEAITAHLALLRVLMTASYDQPTLDLSETFDAGVFRLQGVCKTYLDELRAAWLPTRNLLQSPLGSLDIVSYLVHCARIMQVASLAYFTAQDQATRRAAGEFLKQFIEAEPGCAHPLSDRYAISLVPAILTLVAEGNLDTAKDLLRCTTVWLCNRRECGMGLADLSADEADEIGYLLGYAFEFIALREQRVSFLASTVSDLAAFVGDIELYVKIVNDIKACGIFPQYFQPQDTIGSCRIEAKDVIRVPSLTYADHLNVFSDYEFANHLESESTSYKFADAFGPSASIYLMMLLRDRYFPKLWPLIVQSIGRDAKGGEVVK